MTVYYDLSSSKREALQFALEHFGLREAGDTRTNVRLGKVFSRFHQKVIEQAVSDENGNVTTPAVLGDWLCDIEIRDGGPKLEFDVPAAPTQLRIRGRSLEAAVARRNKAPLKAISDRYPAAKTESLVSMQTPYGIVHRHEIITNRSHQFA